MPGSVFPWTKSLHMNWAVWKQLFLFRYCEFRPSPPSKVHLDIANCHCCGVCVDQTEGVRSWHSEGPGPLHASAGFSAQQFSQSIGPCALVLTNQRGPSRRLLTLLLASLPGANWSSLMSLTRRVQYRGEVWTPEGKGGLVACGERWRKVSIASCKIWP